MAYNLGITGYTPRTMEELNIMMDKLSNVLGGGYGAEDRRKAEFLRGFIESQPQALYQQALMRLTDPMRRYYAGRYGDIYNRYMANQITEAQAGNIPKRKFSDFISGFDFTQDYMKLPYMQRGGYQARSLTPKTRFLPY